jgi:fused signal recognition particle receptor
MDPELVPWAELFELPVEEAASEDAEAPKRRGLFGRLRDTLGGGTEQAISPQLAAIYAPKLVTEDTWDDLEEALILADCGMEATDQLVSHLRQEAREGRVTSGATLAQGLWREVARLMAPEPAHIPLDGEPTVILVIGVNGSGKTTTIGKLAHRYLQAGRKVILGAGDTFRAAAAEQLAIWGERAGVDVIRHAEGADPAAVAFDAARAAVARKQDILIFDTAGRLHTKVHLMEELKKIRRILGREIAGAPHETLLILDAATGQNALNQARFFRDAVAVDGVILTKLDGTARGGIVIAISSELGLPVRYIGIGEGLEDLRPFVADEFVEAIFASE